MRFSLSIMAVMRKLLVASLVALCAVVSVVLAAGPARAWGVQGHNASASVADARLTPAVRAEVTRLLAGEPNPTLAGVSTWADEVRANDPELGSKSAPWHYVNIAENNCTYDAAVNGNGGNNVVAAITEQSRIMADRSAPLAERRQALKFVVHFVGDIHQPMHDGYARDRGGNETRVTYEGRDTNMHSLWDSGLLRSGESATALATRLLALPAPQLGSTDPAQWAQQGCRIAVGAYPPAGTTTLGADYTAKYRPVVESQLRLAGERLARLLNEKLGTLATGSLG
ncbi:S1/P1 nuclease [Gordonia sinesedis]